MSHAIEDMDTFEHPRQFAQSVLNLLNRTYEEEIIQPEDERQHATNEDVLHYFAPAIGIHPVHLHSLHA